MYTGNVQQNPQCAASCVTKDLSISPRFLPTTFHRDANSVLLRAHLFLYSSTLYAQNPMLESVHQQSVKVCLHMYDGNVQQNPRCAASCVTKDIPISPRNGQQNHLCAASRVTKDNPISPRFSPTIFYRDADSVLLTVHSFRYTRAQIDTHPQIRKPITLAIKKSLFVIDSAAM